MYNLKILHPKWFILFIKKERYLPRFAFFCGVGKYHRCGIENYHRVCHGGYLEKGCHSG